VLGSVMDAHVCSCAYVCVCIRVYVYIADLNGCNLFFGLGGQGLEVGF